MKSLGSDGDGLPTFVRDDAWTSDGEFRLFVGGHRHEILVNWLASHGPRLRMLSHGNPTGIQGPDVVSITDGMLERWDLRWRTVDPEEGPSEAALAPLDQAAMEQAVWSAVAAGTLAPVEGIAALRAFDAGTYLLMFLSERPDVGRWFIAVQEGHYTRSRP